MTKALRKAFDVASRLPDREQDALAAAILEELDRIRKMAVGQAELKKSKNHVIGQFLMGLETSDELASFYGQQEIFYKKMITPKEVVQKIEAVTANEVLKLAKDIIKNEHLNLALIGPFKDKKEFERILKLR